MLKTKSTILFLFFVICSLPLFPQIGPHAASIKWQQINIPSARIIFPQGSDKQGLRVANLINYMEKNNKRSIGPLSQKIPIVLHNQTTIANGFVGIGPFRSEFFATPPQSANYLGTLDWLDALTIHEYRHALQFANAKVGLTKLFYFLQGENGWGLLAGSSIPNWFWEGDATVIETALSKGGRGRAPFFTLQQRALLHKNHFYSYAKARNGSYKDLVPSRYPLGYAMIMHAREKFGNDVWQPVFQDAAAYTPLIYPFSNALENETGWSTKDLYKDTYLKMQDNLEKSLQNLQLTDNQAIATEPRKTVTNYRFPYYLNDGSIICSKSSFQQTDALVHLQAGKEKVLTNIGFHIEKYLSVTGSKAVWTEYEQNPRRRYQNYSNIVYYDLNKKTKTRFTNKTRYFSPSFSYSGGRIVAVNISYEQINTIKILNANTGEVLRLLPNPENHFISFPKWAENDTDIIYVAKKNSQLSIFKFNLIDNTSSQLIPWTEHIIADLFVKDNYVYFTGSFSGIDNIFRVALNGEEKIEQISSVPLGAYFPSVSADGKQLVFSEFDELGYYPVSLNLKTGARNKGIQIETPRLQNNDLISTIAEEGGSILENVPTEPLEIKPYKGFFKNMKLHSWNFTPSLSLPTLDLQFDNVLNDLSLNLIGGYNFNEEAPVFVAAATYGKWYPLLTLSTSLTRRNTTVLTNQDSLSTQQFKQISFGGRIAIPLTWVKGDYQTSFQPALSFSHISARDIALGEQELDDFSLGNLQLRFSYARLKRTAYQNVGPRGGQTLNFRFQHTTDSFKDKKVNLDGSLYLPGIGANHNLKLSFAYRRELLKNHYQYSDIFEYPRGFGSILNDEFLRLSADYQLPIVYPDWGFAGITYFKRIRLNLFFDYGYRYIEFADFDSEHNSVGAEIIFDNTFWNELPINIGLRNSYLLTGSMKKYNFEIFASGFLVQ
jgi:hypothetical protein